MSKIIIPTPLRKFTGQQATVEITGQNVLEAVSDLATKHPDLKTHLFDDAGNIRSFIRIFVGDDDILSLQKEQTPIDETTILSIIPAIAGGTSDQI